MDDRRTNKKEKKNKSRSDHSTMPEMTQEELKKTFPRYPSDGDGYLVAYETNQADLYLPVLKKYGFVVVNVLTSQECDETIPEFLQDSNENPKGLQEKRITLEDPSSWENVNWPSSSKFQFSKSACGQKAFDNRCNPRIYELFQHIYQGENKLWISIDKWGVMRGTKNLRMVDAEGKENWVEREDWRSELKMHWDLNPWLYVNEVEKEGHHPMYQGLVALVDCPEEVGGFLCVPGSTPFLSEWTKHKQATHMKPLSIRVPEDDKMIEFKQKVTLRKGQMVVWDSGQAHANFANRGDQCRIYQFIRMAPACEKCKERDRFLAPNVLAQDHYTEEVRKKGVQFTSLGRKLAGLEPWD
eukprot:TRINITY_DN6970_c0_g1_i1.p1 TRINITY_DN6970_c0_g1~~TRINITY_DN6970_c0_g1_i1.p1  ORF type:complete len:355 (-),score=100.96 TRINITY_DN6970_c0_g1_i1:108-1172(-)